MSSDKNHGPDLQTFTYCTVLAKARVVKVKHNPFHIVSQVNQSKHKLSFWNPRKKTHPCVVCSAMNFGKKKGRSALWLNAMHFAKK